MFQDNPILNIVQFLTLFPNKMLVTILLLFQNMTLFLFIHFQYSVLVRTVFTVLIIQYWTSCWGGGQKTSTNQAIRLLWHRLVISFKMLHSAGVTNASKTNAMAEDSCEENKLDNWNLGFQYSYSDFQYLTLCFLCFSLFLSFFIFSLSF